MNKRTWITGEMVVTEENRRAGRKTSPRDTLSTTDITATGLELNSVLLSKTQATNRPSHDTAPFNFSCGFHCRSVTS